MLDGLARLYRQAGDHASAIRAWHDLLATVPAPADAARVRTLMEESFAEALLPGAATGAVRALPSTATSAELMPDGARGRPAAARPRGPARRARPAGARDAAAGELLEQPPSGRARAEAGAALAELWLRAPDPAAALGALERTAVADDLAAPLVARRRLLQARALAAADRPHEALGAARRAHEPQRAARAQRDPLAAPRLAGARAGAREAARPLQRSRNRPRRRGSGALVLRLAVAHAQAADGGALARLRARFGPALRGEAGEPAFLMATMTPGRAVAPEAALAVAAEHRAQVQSYLDAAPRYALSNRRRGTRPALPDPRCWPQPRAPDARRPPGSRSASPACSDSGCRSARANGERSSPGRQRPLRLVIRCGMPTSRTSSAPVSAGSPRARPIGLRRASASLPEV